MSSKRYPEEFKIEAAKQVTERGYSVPEVAKRLDITKDSLYAWIRKYSLPESERRDAKNQAAELRQLKAELKRVTEERDILKKAAVYFAKESQ